MEKQVQKTGKPEGKESRLWGRFFFWLYGIIRLHSLRKMIRTLVLKLEGGGVYSVTIRKIFEKYYNVKVGMFTHGACFEQGNFDRHTIVGRYCSIAADVHVFNRNHPMNFKSTHAFFFNPLLKYTKTDMVKYNPLEIGNDVWIGHSVIILPSVKKIGDGAVVGAGSIVSKDVPPYAVAVGHPIRIVRYRFPKDIINRLIDEKWWGKSIEEIQRNMEEYNQPYEAYFALRNLSGETNGSNIIESSDRDSEPEM